MCNRTKIVNVPTMSFDIQKFLETQQHLIIAEKKRLGLLQDSQAQVRTKDALITVFQVASTSYLLNFQALLCRAS